MIDLNNARKQFEEYLKGYDGSDSKIHLKAVHTFCVMEAADSICQGEGFSQEDRQLALLIALLHDIGKSLQYEQKIPHEISGCVIAAEILGTLPPEAAFSEAEKEQIHTATRGHRRHRKEPELLERLLYESDKASRACFACPAEPECSWDEEKKNKEIQL